MTSSGLCACKQHLFRQSHHFKPFIESHTDEESTLKRRQTADTDHICPSETKRQIQPAALLQDSTPAKTMNRVRESTHQATGRKQAINLMGPDALRQEVKHLDKLLAETRSELARQKTLKEKFINQGKKIKKDLERLRRYSDAETISTTKIATQVRDTIKKKKKKLLQADYEELQVAHIVSVDKSRIELQVEKDRNQVLQEDLERVKVAHHELSLRFETDVLRARQQVESLQRELQLATKSHADKMLEDFRLIQHLRGEHDSLQREINTLKYNAMEKEKLFCKEREELKTQLNLQTSLNLDLSTELKAARDDIQLSTTKSTMCEDPEPCNQQSSLPSTSASTELSMEQACNPEEPCKEKDPPTAVHPSEPSMEQACNPEEPCNEKDPPTAVLPSEPSVEQSCSPEGSSEAVIELLNEDDSMEIAQTRQSPSLWKKTRHFLGLRKPKKWKK